MEAIVANWDKTTLSIGIQGESPEVSYEEFLSQENAEEAFFPDVSGTCAPAQTLLWPLESLVIRTFSLPLPSLRLLDANILGQELEDQCGEPAEGWWIAWQAEKIEDKIEGIMFALPEPAKDALSSHSYLSHCKFIWPDGWVRLMSALPADFEGSHAAVLDADEDGLFLGVYRYGVWVGIRRLNFVLVRPVEELVEDIRLSLEAMGYSTDMAVYGRLNDLLLSSLESIINWQGETTSNLPSRAATNISAALRLPCTSGPNFRHTTWSAKADWLEQFSPWRGVAILALIVISSSFFIDVYSLASLNSHKESLEQNIKHVFHQALPNEKVIIDPVAQLKNVAGSVGNESNAWYYLRQLEAISRLKKKFPAMKVGEVSLIDGEMLLSGSITDFAMVNRARDKLEELVRSEVKVDDTELEKEKKQVRFSLRWL